MGINFLKIMIKKLLLPALLLVFLCNAAAQTSQDVTVALAAEVSTTEPRITLSWPLNGTGNLQIKRRLKGQAGGFWTRFRSESASTLTSLVDENVVTGNTYEYHIRIVQNNLPAHGYAHVAVATPLVDYRGKILVFIDSTTADAVGLELKIFKDAMRGDGWQPVPNKTGPSSTVQSIKNQIITLYNEDPTNVKAVLIIGDVPVPYSGNFAWDGHPDHTGAWPCDAYYADINGTWTDESVNNTTGSREATKNVPGDGKFDQNYLPSPVELMIGRIDFSNLSATTFGATPIELTKRYLLKSARWRTKQYTVPCRALVDDNFGYFGGEAFAASGYRNAYPITGKDNVFNGDFFTQTDAEGYLFGYGCGAGSYNSAAGVGTSTDFATDSINVVFSNIFGSYHGDWDYESNPLLVSAIASKGGILTCAWAGRPHWFLQGLASGEPIGFCTKETMNAASNTEYFNSTGRGGAHVALMGDPTTRAIIVAQVPELTFESQCNTLRLNWTASPDTGILGYHVYRSAGLDGPYTRLTTDLVNDLSWTDNTPEDTSFYQVRAVRIDQTPGGGIFYNASSGIIRFATFQPTVSLELTTAPPAILTCFQPAATIFASANLPLSQPLSWTGPNGFNGTGDTITVTTQGTYTVTATSDSGCSATATVLVLYNTTIPDVEITASATTLSCETTSISLTASSNTPGVVYFWTTQTITPTYAEVTAPGIYCVIATNIVNGCTSTDCVNIIQTTIAPDVQVLTTNVSAPGASNGAITLVLPAGTAATFNWSNGATTQNLVALAEGNYEVVITFDNGCQSTYQVTITATTSTTTLSNGVWSALLSPNPATDFTRLTLHSDQPAAVQVQLWHVNGTLISTQTGGISSDHTFIYDTCNLPGGIYTLVISSGEKSLVRKLIVFK